MKKAIAKIGVMTAVAVALSGCVGSNAVTGYVMGFNLKAVDNRYARGGLNMLMAPVYGVAIAADYIVFNSLEFWTGKNPLNGKPHIFDSKVDTYIDVNHQLDKSLTTAPISPLANNRVIEQGQMKQIDENTIQMDISYSNGDKALLTGVREGDFVTYYIDGEVVAKTSMDELAAYAQTRV
ncbi:DUF3332 domain-containing protein [Vibrio natriegens]|uniref:DUF3332 domain-containing protein n=1 Tax=Vibrio natriegens TaxID=691 RepID=UPI000803EA04|nr:DUF3332 domain-containing protein [Vibrio natriegens]ANQ16310.1 hypothetical protein BA891_03290 [Vibrio natriegens]